MKFITLIAKGWVEIVNTLGDEGLEFSKNKFILELQSAFYK